MALCAVCFALGLNACLWDFLLPYRQKCSGVLSQLSVHLNHCAQCDFIQWRILGGFFVPSFVLGRAGRRAGRHLLGAAQLKCLIEVPITFLQQQPQQSNEKDARSFWNNSSHSAEEKSSGKEFCESVSLTVQLAQVCPKCA